MQLTTPNHMMSYYSSRNRAMEGYVPGEQPQAGKFIKLNTNENPYPPSPAVQRAIGTALEQGLQKYPDPMADAFRHRAARSAGRRAGLDSVRQRQRRHSDDRHARLRRPGRLLRLPYPSYILYKTLAQLQGAEAEEVHFETDWSLADDFAEAAARLKLAFLPNPNSPSGTMLPPERVLRAGRRAALPAAGRRGVRRFRRHELPGAGEGNDKIMVSRTLSKSYALAGLRFGFSWRSRRSSSSWSRSRTRTTATRCRSPAPRPPSTTRPGWPTIGPKSWPRGPG